MSSTSGNIAAGYPDPRDPANVAKVDEIMREGVAPFKSAPLARVFAAPRAGKRDDVELWAIPERTMFAAFKEHREMLDLMEKAMTQLESGAPNVALGLECRAMLARFNRPFRKGNYGEPFYDPPKAVAEAQAWAETAEKDGGWV